MSKTLTLVVELDDNSPAEDTIIKAHKNGDKWIDGFLKGLRITAIGDGDIFEERDALKENLERTLPKLTPLEVADREKIYEIAKATREELYMLYKRISPHVQKHLQGACAHGSVLLFDNLRAAGFRPQIVQSQGHYFAICSGYLVDVTASQFGQPKVVVRPHHRIKEMVATGDYNMNWWNAINIFDEPCHANLCAHRKALNDAREKINVSSCNVCTQE